MIIIINNCPVAPPPSHIRNIAKLCASYAFPTNINGRMGGILNPVNAGARASTWLTKLNWGYIPENTNSTPSRRPQGHTVDPNVKIL